jgi:hypothetical protein
MLPSKSGISCSRNRARSRSRSLGTMALIALPAGPTGSVVESQRSSKLAYRTGVRITRVSTD